MKKIKRFNIQKLYTSEDFGFQKRVEAGTALLEPRNSFPSICIVAAGDAMNRVVTATVRILSV